MSNLTKEIDSLKGCLIPYLDGITTKKGKKYICPLCHSGAGKNGTPAFSIVPNTNETKWKCHSCGEGGDVVDLYKYVNDTEDTVAAVRELSQQFGNGFTPDTYSHKEPEEPAVDYTDFFNEANEHVYESEYLLDRKIENLDIIEKFNIGFVKDWTHPKVPNAPPSPRVIIPTSKYSYLARDTRPNLTGKAKQYAKQKVGATHIFNLNAIYDENYSYCFVTEGEIDCLSVIQCGFNCIGLGSTSMLDSLLNQCQIKPKSVLIFILDNDDAGRKAAEKISAFEEKGILCFAADVYDTEKDANDLLVKNPNLLKANLQNAVDRSREFYEHNKHLTEIQPEIQPETEKSSGKFYHFDDTGNAQRLSDTFGDVLKYNYTDKKWLFYADGKWNYDNIGYHRKIADTVAEMIENDRPLYEDDPKLEKAFEKHLKKIRDYNGKTNMLKEYEHYSPITPQMLDQNKAVIGCKNGILDLKDGKLYPHDKKAFITKQVPVNYNPNAPEPSLWLNFLNDIFARDESLINYVQKCVGYSLSGSTVEQCLFFLYGTGSNGKSVFLDIIRYILGDYATNIQPQTLMTSPKAGNAPSSDIARLKGARLVTSVEPNEGMWLDEGLVKQLTGDDVVTARKMFGEEFEFKPEFKIWLATNHKPRIRGTDDGIWRRIHLIPFNVRISDEKKDKFLKNKLLKEAECIFKWAVDGCMLWNRQGLNKPKSVLDATTEYRHEMDVISSFIEDCCIVGDTHQVKASELYSTYVIWAETNNEYRIPNTKFGLEMAKRFEKTKTRTGAFYKGISPNNEYKIY